MFCRTARIFSDYDLSFWFIGFCPKGFDPFQANANFRAFNFTVSANTVLGGTLTMRVGPEKFQFSANATHFDAADCTAAFEALHGIKEASCTRSTPTKLGGAIYTVTIRDWPDIPYQNNVFMHDGNPDISYFDCDVSKATGQNVSCIITDAKISSIKGK